MSAAAATTSAMPAHAEDVPRQLHSKPVPADRLFRGLLRGAGIAVLAITGSILLFLVIEALPAFRDEGWRFLTQTNTLPPDEFGVGALLPYTVLVAVISLVVALPAGLAAAIYISEYAPPGLQRPLISVIDLLAAIPSIVFGLWGFLHFMPQMLGNDSWLSHHLSLLPCTSVQPDEPQSYVGSVFIAAIVVGMLVTPIICSLSRQVFSQAPQGEREAAYALGSTRWGMVRTVVLPFGRAGVIGSAMLGLGRALGETIVVTFILVPTTGFNCHILQSGGNTITDEVATHVVDFGTGGLPFLFAAGLVLFVMTLIINTLAAIVISRSRSGSSTQAD
ncbi:MAG TPA: phosphate ABC transporter permease subunit PstC [Streptosporangiaceae bacterium]|nr:phosphate ABC transporter permease subunit PstC [Streptosporangiaceae bacterium]